MRCFLAVDISGELKRDIEQFQKQLDCPGLKKVPRENLHVTLKFLGNFDPDRIKSRLKGMEIDAFESRTTGIGYFPKKDYARVIWLGLEEKNFGRIVREIEKRLSLPEGKHDFIPHITIARARKALKNLELEFNPNKTVKVDKITLYSSELTRKGPIYTKLAKF